jgi:nucleotide-binding universal stress UspA family protein
VGVLAAPLARARGAAVHVLHVIETDVLAGENTADLESTEHAQALLDACVAELSEADVPVTGELLHSYGTHTDVAVQILHRATELGAGAIVLGAETRHGAASSVNAYIATHAPSHVIIINPAAGALVRPSAGGPVGDPSIGAGLVPLATEPEEEIENFLGPSPEPFPQSRW